MRAGRAARAAPGARAGRPPARAGAPPAPARPRQRVTNPAASFRVHARQPLPQLLRSGAAPAAAHEKSRDLRQGPDSAARAPARHDGTGGATLHDSARVARELSKHMRSTLEGGARAGRLSFGTIVGGAGWQVGTAPAAQSAGMRKTLALTSNGAGGRAGATPVARRRGCASAAARRRRRRRAPRAAAPTRAAAGAPRARRGRGKPPTTPAPRPAPPGDGHAR